MNRRTTILVAVGAAVLIGLGTAIGLLIGTSSDDNDSSAAAEESVDRSSARAVATAFIKRYATGDPAACALVTAEIRSEMRSAGRCQGQVRGHAAPSITYLRTVICPPASPSASSVQARVEPPGQIGTPYIRLSLTNSGDTWSISTVSPRTSPPTGKPARCKPAATEFGGS